jgi:2-oxoglutarate ferredoxin oxidoreductase subunit alpha
LAPDDGVPPLPAFGDGYRFHVTGLTHDERGFPTTDAVVAEALITRIHRKVEVHRDEISEVETFMLDDADIAIFAYGIVGRSAREAVQRARLAGVKAGLIRPVTLWPFPYSAVAEVASQVDTLIVSEMNLGQLIGEVERAAVGRAEIVGHLRADGEPITPTELLDVLMSGGGGQP